VVGQNPSWALEGFKDLWRIALLDTAATVIPECRTDDDTSMRPRSPQND
jgi:hypothetical protein